MGFCEDDDCGRELPAVRSDARYCSSACRQRSYRRRKKLLEPYGGDIHAAWAHAVAFFEALPRVTDNEDASRNADGPRC